jgi:hypothetical protein
LDGGRRGQGTEVLLWPRNGQAYEDWRLLAPSALAYGGGGGGGVGESFLRV